MKLNIQRISIVIFCAFISLSLSGCSFFSPVKTTPDTLYLLDRIPPKCAHYKTKRGTLLVMLPDTVAAFNTSQMAFSLRRYHVGFYGKNRWAASPSQMLQPLMVKAIDDSGAYRAVVPAPFAGNYDFVLNSQVIELIHDYGVCPPKARLVVRAQLVNAATGRIIRTKEFIKTSNIRRAEPYSAVWASNRTVANFLSSLAFFVSR